MKKLVLVISALLFSLPAQAISRYNSTGMSCAEVQGRIQSDGAAIMRYRSTFNPSLPLYGRYVRNRLFCQLDEQTATVFIPSADRKSCPVYECEKIELDDFPTLRLRRN